MYTNSNVAAAEQSKPHRQGRRPYGHDERGLAMIYALLGILLLSMLAAALMLVSSTEAYASFNYKTQTQGSFVARAGVERAVDWFLRVYGPQLNPNLATSNIAAGTYDLLSQTQPLYPSTGGGRVILGDSANFPTAAQFGGFDAVAVFDGIRTDTVNLGNATGRYRVDTAELLSHDRYKGVDQVSDVVVERWRLTVTGRIQGALVDTVVQDTAVIRTNKIPLFRDAIRGACNVQMNGSLTTNSYDGSTGPYNTPPGTNINTGKYAGASVASNSFVGSSGTSSVINGQLFYGTGANPCPPGESVDDDNIAYQPPVAAPGVPYPPIPAFTAGTGSNDCKSPPASPFLIGSYTLAMTGDIYDPVYLMDKNGGTPQGDTMGDCDLAGQELLMFRVPDGETPQKFYMRNIKAIGNSGLIMVHDSPPYLPCQRTDVVKCAPVQLYVEDTFDLGGGGLIASSPGDPTRFSVYIAKPSGCPGGATCCATAADCGKYTGNSDFFGTVYAPNCSFAVGGNGDVFGAITACNVTTAGGAMVHFDLQLKDLYVIVSPFRVVNQSRRVF